MTKIYFAKKVNDGKSHRLSETIVEPSVPMTTKTLMPAIYRIRRSVYESDNAMQSTPDEATLPMPPHNMALSAAALIQLMENKLGIKNIVQKALGLLKRAA